VSAKNQFVLLRERRFAPLFWVQFLGAANDNLFKFAFTLLATYAAARWGNVDPHFAGFLIGALFIAPFVLFSATSGQLADKLEKSRFIRRIKDAEIAVALVGGAGLALQSAPLVCAIFLLGLQSTVFGPVKYSYLPQHLDAHELTGGNGLVEMGTFVAILLGTIGAGLLIGELGDYGCAGRGGSGAGDRGARWHRGAVRAALAGRRAGLRDQLEPVHRNLGQPEDRARQRGGVQLDRRHLLAVVLRLDLPDQLHAYARENLGGNEGVVTFLLAVFSIGIGAGSLACERLSRRRVEIGLVPLGSIGMTVFAVDLYFASVAFAPMADGTLAQFLAARAHWRIVADLALLRCSPACTRCRCTR
jgi:hypothetical protein